MNDDNLCIGFVTMNFFVESDFLQMSECYRQLREKLLLLSFVNNVANPNEFGLDIF